MKNRILFIFVIIILGSKMVFAHGVGLYGTVKPGYTYYPSRSYGGDSNAVGIGIVYDTALARDSLINYRLNIDYSLSFEDKKDESFFAVYNSMFDNINRITMTHSVGFRIYRNKILRLWIGPQLMMAATFSFPYHNAAFGITGGIGPVIGLNINIGSQFTISLSSSAIASGSFRTYMSNEFKPEYYAFLVQSFPAGPSYVSAYKQTHVKEGGIGIIGQVNVAFMVRFDDKYRTDK